MNIISILYKYIISIFKQGGQLICLLKTSETRIYIIVLAKIAARYLSTVENLSHNHKFSLIFMANNMFGGVKIYLSNDTHVMQVIHEFQSQKL